MAAKLFIFNLVGAKITPNSTPREVSTLRHFKAKKRGNPGRGGRDQAVRMEAIFNRRVQHTKSCNFCQKNKEEIFELTPRDAEGLPGRWLCADCHRKILEIETAIRKLNNGARTTNDLMVAEAMATLRESKPYLGLANALRAVDAVRTNTKGHKDHYRHQKDTLALLVFELFRDTGWLNAQKDKHWPILVKLRVASPRCHWCCHVSPSLLPSAWLDLHLSRQST